jgi:hypothetical protein
MNQQNDIQNSIEKLTHFASEHGFNVTFDANSDGDFFYPTSKRIVIRDDERDVKIKLFYLLHETGHMLTHLKKEEWKLYNLRYTLDDDIDDEKSFNESRYQCATLSEEHTAWSNGKKLIKDFDIKLNIEEYENEWSDALKDYITQAYRALNK